MEFLVFIMGLIRGAILTLICFVQMTVYYWYISIPIILGVVAVPFVVRILRAVFSRISFVVKVKIVVNRRKGKVKFLRVPFASFLANNGKADIYIDVCGEEYALKFYPGNPLNRKVYIHDNECVYTARRNAQALFGRGVRGRCDLVFNKADTKMKKRRLKVNLSENKNTILLISPLPYEIYVYDGNQYRMTGNGERFNDMTIYTSNGFLDFLQRK